MRCADRMNEDLHVGLLAHDRPDASGVVEMDVGDEDLRQLRGVESRRLDPGVERWEGRSRPGLNQSQFVRSGQQVGVDDTVPPLKPEIDSPDALVDPCRRAPRKCSWRRLPHTKLPAKQLMPDMYVQSMASLAACGCDNPPGESSMHIGPASQTVFSFR